LYLKDLPTNCFFLLETNVRSLNIRFLQFLRRQSGNLFLTGLHLTGALTGSKARDEFLQLRYFLGLVAVLVLDGLASLQLVLDHIVVIAGIDNDGVIVDVGDVRADRIEEMTIVGDDYERSFIFVEEVFQPMN